MLHASRRGFTLVELIVGIAIFTILALGIIVLVSNILTSSSQQSGLLADSDQGRKLAFRIMGEVRNGSVSSTGAYTLDTASDQQLIFYSNVDGGVDIERIRYYLSGGSLYRGVVKPTGSPLAYNLGSETSSVVQKNVANGAIPLFYYYNDSYDGTSDIFLTQPVNVTDVRMVKLNLRVYNKAGKTNTNYYTVTASGTIRGLKTNLGN
jgi:prepilin-type N-terminal cleavage/methylation domain-containing protein